MSQQIVITGANGFIGHYLCHYLSEKNHTIIGLAHHLPTTHQHKIQYRAFDLANFASDVIPENTDIVIHTAYQFKNNLREGIDLNYKATKRLYDFSQQKKVKLFIYFSSFAATSESISAYGQSKYQTSNLFDLEKDLVIAPGLVIGNGGLFSRISAIIEQSKLIPLIGGGRQPLQYIDIQDLARIISNAIDHQIRGNYLLAHPSTIEMRDFYHEIAKSLHRKPVFIPINYFFSEMMFNLIQWLKLGLGFDKENFMGLKQMHEQQISPAEAIFHVQLKPLSEILSRIFKSGSRT
jgi:nucleoside-diphosphate-sugar epimerase